MRYILLLSTLLLGYYINAQNLIPNPGFEQHTTCNFPMFQGLPNPIDTNETIFPELLNWRSAHDTPDYFNTCNTPQNLPWYNISPRSGNGCVGLVAFYSFGVFDTIPGIGPREFIQCKLTQPLMAGCAYNVSFYVRLSPRLHNFFNDILSTDGIGAYFSTTAIDALTTGATLFSYTPQISNPTGNLISDTTNWTLISGTFTASGNEEYCTIGNFLDNANTQFQQLTFINFGQTPEAYFFIDDVSLTPVVPPGYSLNLGNDTTICNANPFSVTLTAQSGFINYLWSTGATTQSIIVTTPGDYWVDANFGCGVLRDTLTVSTQATVEQLYSLGPDSTICSASNLPITLNAPAGFNNYLWSTSSTTASTTTTPPGIVWVQSNYACGTVSDSVFIASYNSGNFSIGNDTTLCSNSPIILDAGSGFDAYTWNAGSTIQTQQINQAGIYSVIVTIDHGCSLYDTLVALNNFPPVSNFADSLIVCKEDNYQLNVTDGNINTTYQWNTGANTTAILITETGTYSVTATNECGTTSDSIYITLKECDGDPFIPNAFSPNGDGQNDILLVRGYNIAAMHLLIYDRWGGLMFESNDQANGWDGTFKGQAVSTAVFAYSFQATLANGSEIMKKGNISLIR
ncbi:hypothetical protein BH11BAC7_BH11BAC7_12280 [soil metagenome]